MSAHGRGRGGGTTLGPGDWECPKCDSHNFSRREDCFRCKTTRPVARGKRHSQLSEVFTPSALEPSGERRGFGGGFLEREMGGPVYVRRTEVAEYDEYGRKTSSGAHQHGPHEGTSLGNSTTSTVDAQHRLGTGSDNGGTEEDEDEDEEEDGDVSKYDLLDDAPLPTSFGSARSAPVVAAPVSGNAAEAPAAATENDQDKGDSESGTTKKVQSWDWLAAGKKKKAEEKERERRRKIRAQMSAAKELARQLRPKYVGWGHAYWKGLLRCGPLADVCGLSSCLILGSLGGSSVESSVFVTAWYSVRCQMRRMITVLFCGGWHSRSPSPPRRRRSRSRSPGDRRRHRSRSRSPHSHSSTSRHSRSRSPRHRRSRSPSSTSSGSEKHRRYHSGRRHHHSRDRDRDRTRDRDRGRDRPRDE
eukprot:m.207327 g.207327  ORF g.207327 m.207327 type:complete len:416 (-) comp18924_c0_seq10:95-1342(-)